MKKSLDLYSTKFKNILVLPDFHVEMQSKCMMDQHLSQDRACFKNTEIPFRIDLVLTNCLYSFQTRGVTETGLSIFITSL